MADLFDYLLWRGDLTFSKSGFCEIDGVIFSMLTYLDLEKLGGGESISLKDAAGDYCSGGNYDSVDMGLILPSPNINRLFCEAVSTGRFSNVYFSNYVSRTSDCETHQFAAVTFHLDTGQMVVAFRGTDDSIVGWREDCCLAFMDEIPAQRMATEYLNSVAERFPDRRIYVVGHSKGGNLTLYASLKCEERVARRILRAYCYDGPGLSKSMISARRYALMESRFTVLLPQSSYVGILFEKGEKYTVVRSEGIGPFQHDPFLWILNGPRFETLPRLSESSMRKEEHFRKKLESMTPSEKKLLVEMLFDIIGSTGAKTLSDFNDGRINKIVTLLKACGGFDKETREAINALLFRLVDVEKGKKRPTQT